MSLFASRTRRRGVYRFAVLLVLFLSMTARGQDLDDVSIGGLVTDEQGAVVAGASVTARNELTRSERAAVTDGEGRYRLLELAPGSYTVRASAPGFAAEERKVSEALAGQGVRLDFTLRPAGLAAEQVVVTGADAPLVDTSRTIAGGTVAREEIERLPLASRSVLDFVFTLGGVAEEPLSVRDAAAVARRPTVSAFRPKIRLS